MTSDGSLQKKLDSALERASAAEQETLEQARLNGMGSEREARLLGKIAELERALLKANGEGGLIDYLQNLVRDAYNEGFQEGMNEFQKTRSGGKAWPDSDAIKKLQTLIERRKRLLGEPKTANEATPRVL
jgi:flagellar biosynthesis/type III secretory pathway protein FliH